MVNFFRDRITTLSPLDTDSKRRGLRFVTIAWGFGTVWFVTVFGAPLTGFATKLGADALVLGIIGALPNLSQVLQLPGSYLTERLQKRKQVFIWSCLLGRMAWFPIAILPLVMEDTRLRLAGLMLLLVFSFSMGALASPSWISWMNDLIARRIRGRYFARRAAFSAVVNILALTYISWYLDQNNNFSGYAIAFLIAALCGCIDILFFFYVPDVPMQPEKDRLAVKDIVVQPWRDPKFRRFLIFTMEWCFAIGIAAPFFNHYFLNYLKVDYIFIHTRFTIIYSICSIIALYAWGKVLDKHGPRAVYRVCGMSLTIVPMIWILCHPDFLWLFPLNAVLCAIDWSGISLAQFNMLLESAPQKRKSMYMACFGLVSGLTLTLSPVVGGAFLKLLSGFSLELGGFTIINLHLLFLATGLLRLASVLHLGSMPGAEKDNLHATHKMFWRGVREWFLEAPTALGQLAGWLPVVGKRNGEGRTL